MKRVQMAIRLLFIVLLVVLTIWSYADGDMLKAIFWLMITKIDMDGFEQDETVLQPIVEKLLKLGSLLKGKDSIPLDKSNKYKTLSKEWRDILIPSKKLSPKVKKKLEETDTILMETRYGKINFKGKRIC